jgi:aspartate/methionine/tyrosine aminotransferase
MALEVFRSPKLLTEHVPFYERARAAGRAVEPQLGAPLLLGGGAFYGILDVSAFANGDPLKLALAILDAEDVVTVPGIAFGAGGEWFLRLSYAAGETPFREGLTRIGRFLSRRAENGKQGS